ncbi:helix-turn-helix domain-containing protein [Dactylosporangium sp. McL0621]|uniref:helix-turn-helix domain-containing protein n=1 Tax=Dactylosporangium sp. McL0621 TaxID=3415678 RepID=UPI003CF6C0AC
MPTDAPVPIRLPAGFWDRTDVTDALAARDIGALFRLLRQYAQATQLQIERATGIPQPEVSRIMRSQRQVTTHELLTRIADGFNMPNRARARLGLAYHNQPRAQQTSTVDWRASTVDVSDAAEYTLSSDFRAGRTVGPDEHNTDRADDSSRTSREPRRSPSATTFNRDLQPVDVRDSPRDTDDVLRRTVLSAFVALGTYAPLRSSAEHASSVLGTAEDWREAAWEYGFTYLSQSRSAFLRELAPDLVAIQRQMTAIEDEREAKQLASVGAQLAALMAMACTHLRYFREARHAWRLARRLGVRSGSTEAQAWVQGHEITSAIYLQRPVSVVLQLVNQATVLEGRTFAGSAELLAGKAQIFAALGRKEDALAAISQANATFDRLPDAIVQQSDSIFGWPEDRIRHAEAYVHARIGGNQVANASIDRALRLYDSSRTISKAQLELHRALALIRSGEVGEGTRHATWALNTVPSNHLGQLVLLVADDVLRAVPESDRGRPNVVSYRDRLIAARNSSLKGEPI